MDTFKQYGSFHDWYLMSISVDRASEAVELTLMFDDKRQRARVLFKGASRCFMTDFLIQNIIYDARILTDFNTPEYKHALNSIEKSYFGKESHSPKPIAAFSATLGAELLVEFETLDVVPEPPAAS